MGCVSWRHLVALAWFHLMNQSRRWVANYIAPALVLGVCIAYAKLAEVGHTTTTLDNIQMPFGGGFGDYSDPATAPPVGSERLDCFNYYCEDTVWARETAPNVTQFVLSFNRSIEYESPDILKVQVGGQEFDHIMSQYLSNLACLCSKLDPSQQSVPGNPMVELFDRNFDALEMPGVSLIVMLFFLLVLSEAREDRQQHTADRLSALGVSRLEQFLCLILLHLLLSMIWAAISITLFMFAFASMQTSLVFLWGYLVALFLTAAVFALAVERIVVGTLTFLAVCLHLPVVYLVIYIAYQVTTTPTASVPTPVRLLLMLHPTVLSYNFGLFLESAEYSQLGLSLATLTSNFHTLYPGHFFGNPLEQLVCMAVVCVLGIVLWSVNLEFLEAVNDWITSIVHRDSILYSQQTDDRARHYSPDESVSHSQPPIVSINNLHKVYHNGTTAVHDLSLDIYPGEILGLLGKNGAGKSTTMNIIAGFLRQTSGSVSIAGFDTLAHPNQTKARLSFCPQDNLFFSRLTVANHLRLMCLLKGATYSEKRAKELLAELHLDKKYSVKTTDLSGGEKRRICVAMAFIADSPVVILDEPTSGVDASSRRVLWDFIQNQQRAANGSTDEVANESSEPLVDNKAARPKRAVILCTHFMEEADVLSQRIAIVADGGQLCDLGSAEYLKRKHGVGYQITCSNIGCTPLINALAHLIPSDKQKNPVQIEEISDHSCRITVDFDHRKAALVRALEDTCIGFHITVEDVTRERLLNEVLPGCVQQRQVTQISESACGITVKYSVFNGTEEDNRQLMRKKLAGLEFTEEDIHVQFSFTAASLEDVFIKLSVVADDAPEQPRSNPIEANNGGGGGGGGADNAAAGNESTDFQGSEISLLSSLVFSLYTDGVLQFKNSWLFFLLFSLCFFLVPFGMLKLPSTPAESVTPSAGGNITVGFDWMPSKPPSIMFIACSEERTRTAAALYPELGIVTRDSVEQVYESYYKEDFPIYSRYPFLVSCEGGDRMSCVLNPHFASSAFLCLVTVNNIHRKSLGLDPDILYYVSSSTQQSEEPSPPSGPPDDTAGDDMEAMLKGMIMSVLEPLLFSALVYYLVRLEQTSVLERTDHYSRANGRDVFVSVVVRATRLMPPLVAYLAALTVWAELAHWTYQGAPGYYLAFSWPLVGLYALFVLVVPFFSILLASVFTSVTMNMVFTVVATILYAIIIFKFNVDLMLKEYKTWVYLLVVVPGFLSPMTSFGLVMNPTRHQLARNLLLAQLAVCLLAVLINKSLVCRTLMSLCGVSRVSPAGAAEGEEEGPDENEDSVCLKVEGVSHVYRSLNVAASVTGTCRHRSCAHCRPVKATSAVNDMRFKVHRGECYALLGVNGAGKSTTFELITGNLPITRGGGRISIAGTSLGRWPLAALRNVGYCPQIDSIPMFLTVDQLFDAFCKLRAVRAHLRDVHKRYFVKELELERHMHKAVGSCSGGTKRKVCTAMAFIGFPKLIVLDECTTGMDPMIRKNVSNLIGRATRVERCAVVISSHTMEEVEKSADRICIMVAGHKEIEGSSEELRHKYGGAYTSCIKIRKQEAPPPPPPTTGLPGDRRVPQTAAGTPDALIPPVAVAGGPAHDVVDATNFDLINSRLFNNKANFKHVFESGSYRHFFCDIPKSAAKLSEILEGLESDNDLNIVESTVNSCTLEHIFMQIAMNEEYGTGGGGGGPTQRDHAPADVQISNL